MTELPTISLSRTLQTNAEPSWQRAVRFLLTIVVACLGVWYGLKALEDLHKEIAGTNRGVQQGLDMQLRTFHYVRPHTAKVPMCPECITMRTMLNELDDPWVLVPTARYEELLAIERGLIK